MRLEDEIKQSKFKSEYHKLGVNILYTANWLALHHTKQCKEYDITPEQFNILRILRGQHPKPATVNLLIDRMLDKNSNASRLVEKLRVKKLVERATCPEDRRAVNVVITQKGLDLLAEIDKTETSYLKELKNLTEKEAEQINFLLDKLRG